MRKVIEYIHQLRWGTLDQRMESGLVQLFDVLAKTRLHNRYWMNGGLLLGCIRNGGPLAHDYDADFSFWEEDMDVFLEGMDALKRNGFAERPFRKNKDGTRTKWAFRFKGVKYEFYLMRRVGGKMRWFSHAHKGTLELVNDAPIHGLNEIELFGRRWLNPDDHETYLESVYGNWRVPNPDYHYCTDSRAVVARYPREG